jgi:N-acetyl-gamma-glutamyl-phosphate reductase
MTQIGAIILGGSGYGVGELLRYLKFHPEVEVVSITSASNVGERVEDLHPHLASFYPTLSCVDKIDLEKLRGFKNGIIFSSLPHGTSSQELGKLFSSLPENLHCIDLSGDLRLQDENLHEEHYPDIPFQSELRKQFSYSIPELHPLSARHVANPGCLSTASALALAPLVSGGGKFSLQGSVAIDAKTGTSGAGRSPQASMHHPRRHGNFEAYKVLSHRHEPEIRQATGLPGKISLAFVPHLLPTSRGILVTLYAEFGRGDLSQRDVEDHFAEFYRDRRFIRLRKQTPNLQDVIGTNFADIAVTTRGAQVVVIAAIDNMGKGMAGQAIQNMNRLCGLKEETGLEFPSLGI